MPVSRSCQICNHYSSYVFAHKSRNVFEQLAYSDECMLFALKAVILDIMIGLYICLKAVGKRFIGPYCLWCQCKRLVTSSVPSNMLFRRNVYSIFTVRNQHAWLQMLEIINGLGGPRWRSKGQLSANMGYLSPWWSSPQRKALLWYWNSCTLPVMLCSLTIFCCFLLSLSSPVMCISLREDPNSYVRTFWWVQSSSDWGICGPNVLRMDCTPDWRAKQIKLALSEVLVHWAAQAYYF